MARRTTQQHQPPTVAPSAAIGMLRELKAKAEALAANPPIDYAEKNAWDAGARRTLTNVFGANLQSVSDVMDVNMYAVMVHQDPSQAVGQRIVDMRERIVILGGLIETLESEVRHSAPDAAANRRTSAPKADSFFHAAMMCPNGHIVNPYSDSEPVNNATFSTECGEWTTTTCQSCSEAIRGPLDTTNAVKSADWKRPRFCHNCGQPYP